MRHFGQTRRYRKIVRSFTNEALNEWQSCYPLNDLYTIMRKSLTFYRSGIKGNKWCGSCIIIYPASQLHPSIVWPRHDVRELFDILGLILLSSYMNYGHTMKSTCVICCYMKLTCEIFYVIGGSITPSYCVLLNFEVEIFYPTLADYLLLIHQIKIADAFIWCFRWTIQLFFRFCHLVSMQLLLFFFVKFLVASNM